MPPPHPLHGPSPLSPLPRARRLAPGPSAPEALPSCCRGALLDPLRTSPPPHLCELAVLRRRACAGACGARARRAARRRRWGGGRAPGMVEASAGPWRGPSVDVHSPPAADTRRCCPTPRRTMKVFNCFSCPYLFMVLRRRQIQDAAAQPRGPEEGLRQLHARRRGQVQGGGAAPGAGAAVGDAGGGDGAHRRDGPDPHQHHTGPLPPKMWAVGISRRALGEVDLILTSTMQARSHPRNGRWGYRAGPWVRWT